MGRPRVLVPAILKQRSDASPSVPASLGSSTAHTHAFPLASPPLGSSESGRSLAEDLDDSIRSAADSQYRLKPPPPRPKPKFQTRSTATKAGFAAGGLGGGILALLLIARIVGRIGRIMDRHAHRQKDPPAPDYRTSPQATSPLQQAGGGATFDLPQPHRDSTIPNLPEAPMPAFPPPALPPTGPDPFGPGELGPGGFGPGGLPGGIGPGGFDPGGLGAGYGS